MGAERTALAGARLVVVGGGVAGLEIASSLGKKALDTIASVTLIDSDSAHVWKPMLHTIAAGTRDLAQQQTTYLAQAPMPVLPTNPAKCADSIAPPKKCCWHLLPHPMAA